jgi:hypothetical protein
MSTFRLILLTAANSRSKYSPYDERNLNGAFRRERRARVKRGQKETQTGYITTPTDAVETFLVDGGIHLPFTSSPSGTMFAPSLLRSSTTVIV